MAYSNFSTAHEMDVLRQRLKADRTRSDRERLELLSAMQEALQEAKRRQNEHVQQVRRQDAFMQRCRAEADQARASFEADVKRRQAFFDASAAAQKRRESEKAQHAEEQRRREEAGTAYGLASASGAARAPPCLRTPQQERAYDAFEAAFVAFEGAPADVSTYTMASLPWPPSGCCVSGARKGDSDERRKQRLKLALLRWHPDKFEAAHGGKLDTSQRAAIMEKVTETLRRVQAERSALAEADEPDEYGTQPAQDHSRRSANAAAAAAAARSKPTAAARAATSSGAPRVSRPSRAARAPVGSIYEGRFS